MPSLYDLNVVAAGPNTVVVVLSVGSNEAKQGYSKASTRRCAAIAFSAPATILLYPLGLIHVRNTTLMRA